MANKEGSSNDHRTRAIRKNFSFDYREGVKEILSGFECSPARGFYPMLKNILNDLCHLIAEKSSENIRRNGVLTENDILNSINLVIPDNIKRRVFEKIRNSHKHLPYSVHCILHQVSEAHPNQRQFQECPVQSPSQELSDVILQTVSVEDAMSRMLADVERNFKAQNTRTREFPDCSTPKINIPVLDNLIPQSSQTSSGMFSGVSSRLEVNEGANHMDTDNLRPQNNNENQAFRNSNMSVNRDMVNEEIDLASLDLIDFLINETRPFENNQMVMNLIETAGFTGMDVDYPSTVSESETQNGENQAFGNSEMACGRHMENEQDHLYTAENENNQIKEKEVTKLESWMYEEHQPYNSFCIMHPSGTANHEFEENEAFEQVTAMNEEYEVTPQANISEVLTEVLEAVHNPESHSSLQSIPDNVHNESYYGDVQRESYEGNLMQEYGTESMEAFYNDTQNYEIADESMEPMEPEPMEPMEHEDELSNLANSEMVNQILWRNRWYYFLPFIPFV